MSDSIRTVSNLLERVGVDPGATASPPWFKDRANLWFRGHSREEWPLLPQVLRDGFKVRAKALNPDADDAVFSFEASLFNQFRRRGHYLLSTAGALTNAYFLAQHHGLPTRLLDWSTNPLVGLFFAVSANSNHAGSVSVMRARNDVPGQEERDIMYPEDPEVDAFLKSFIGREFSPQSLSGLPLRIIPDLHAGRMLQQDARFTLHQPGCQNLHEAKLQGSSSSSRSPPMPRERFKRNCDSLVYIGARYSPTSPTS